MGGRLDDLSLRNYRETLDDDSDIVHLFTPVDQPEAFYALYGWAPGGALDFADVPGPNTLWSVAEGDTLAPGRPLTLRWENDSGLTFLRRFEIDENYMFTVIQSVENRSQADARLAPYGIIARHGEPSDTTNFFILHEGMVQMSDGTLNEGQLFQHAQLSRAGARGGPCRAHGCRIERLDRISPTSTGWRR
jgi:YidC/Oxa1 family membrane protein insertase